LVPKLNRQTLGQQSILRDKAQVILHVIFYFIFHHYILSPALLLSFTKLYKYCMGNIYSIDLYLLLLFDQFSNYKAL